jgi:beta-lactamase class A
MLLKLHPLCRHALLGAAVILGFGLAGTGAARADDGCAPLPGGARAAAGPANASPADAAALRTCRNAGLQQGLQALVRTQGLEAAVDSGRLALALLDLTPGQAPRLAMLNGDRMMYAASLPKIAILLGALVEADAGRLPLDEARIAALDNMIRHSSNADATRVLDWVGGERLLQILESPRYRLYDRDSGGGLWVGKAYGQAPAFRRDPLANLSHAATAFQVARLYSLLAQDALFEQPQFNALMLQALSRPGIRHKFVAGLAERPDAVLWRKSGTWQDTHADSALVESGGHRFVMVAIAHSPEGGEWLRRLAAPLHDLVVVPQAATLALGRR